MNEKYQEILGYVWFFSLVGLALFGMYRFSQHVETVVKQFEANQRHQSLVQTSKVSHKRK